MSSFDSPKQSNDNITDQYLGGATTWKTYSWVSRLVVLHTLITISFELLTPFDFTAIQVYTHKSYFWFACMVRSFGTCDVRMLAEQA